jgi:hypothetical protein
MVARVRPEPAGLRPTPTAPSGANGQITAPDEQSARPVSDAARAQETSPLGPFAAMLADILSLPRVEPDRLARVLGAVTSLALAAGTDDEPAVAPLVAVLDVLDADFQTLLRLIDEGDDQALRAQAQLARARAADLAELLRREHEPLARLDLEPRTRAALLRAPELARRVRELAEEVEATFAVPAGELEPGGLDVDEDELRGLIAITDATTLAGIIEPGLPRPAGIAASAPTCGETLEALRTWLERPEAEPAPLPQPRRLQVEPIDVVPDFVELAAQALTWLASLGDATLDKWVIGGTWSQATARMAAAVEAWSRWGPAGDSSLAADLDPYARLEIVGRDEVGVTTRTEVRRPIAATENEDAAEAEPGAGDPLSPQPDEEHAQ